MKAHLSVFRPSNPLKWGALLAVQMVAASSLAAVRLNSMCYMEEAGAQAMAFNATKAEIAESGSSLLKRINTETTDEEVKKQFRIASLSKVFTSHWAVMKLGPEYRFTTKIHVTPTNATGVCNVHFQGDGDPLVGREVLTEVFKDLKLKLTSLKCASIETMSYDENFRVLLDVMSHQKSSQALSAFGWSNPAIYQNDNRTKSDFTSFVKVKSGLKVKLENIGLVHSTKYSEYLKSVPVKTFEFKSRPLHRILKELNKYSHNYITNVIFSRLGGAEAYSQFIQERLKLSAEQVHLLNGSGYPVVVDGKKIYNVASCEALVLVMRDMDLSLRAYKGTRAFQVADIMPVGGPSEDYSTFKSQYSSSTFDRTIAAKTGSAELAITFGGVLSTQAGNLYFGVLTSPDRYGAPDVPQARDLIRDLMGVMADRVKLKKFDYNPDGPTALFDSEIRLKESAKSDSDSVAVGSQG